MKAQSQKAGRPAMEESDRGEVPMNQPNKGAQALAEVGEGRLRGARGVRGGSRRGFLP